ncbi:uncharacterized protein LOC142776664 isoform X1 [Rhipicephalus microplus]|uniref:uncharacterized protein LOC142776664 isoform X1 n=1 Tax=Rhipicephalus microplus TaxID=6941 RepID=UPI003F6D3833
MKHTTLLQPYRQGQQTSQMADRRADTTAARVAGQKMKRCLVLAVCAAFLLPIVAAGYLGGGGPDVTLHKDKYGHFGVSVRYDQRGYGYLPLGYYGGGHGGGY